MKYFNTTSHFGFISILVHWIMAVIIIGLFVLGKYMHDLDYYDVFYHIGPWWHKSFGLLIAFLLIFRILWHLTNSKVKPVLTHKSYEIKLAVIMKILLYTLMFVCCISGILISTAEDASISFFDVLELPALISYGGKQADLAGIIHEYSTTALIVLAVLHMAAALKHHYIDKDKTLIRILTTKHK